MLMGSVVLEIALGLAFVYLLLSLLCTSLNELIAGFSGLRGKNLLRGLHNLLGSVTAARLYDHALVKGLYRSDTLPSYIHPRTFADALLDIIAPAQAEGPMTASYIRHQVAALLDPNLRQILLVLLDESGNDVAKLRQGIEQWFDSAMDRVSGWYKRKTQAITFVLALSVTVVVNADTIMIANTLSKDSALRSIIVSQAEAFSKASAGSQTRTQGEQGKDPPQAVDPPPSDSSVGTTTPKNLPPESQAAQGSGPHPPPDQKATPTSPGSPGGSSPPESTILYYQTLQNLGLPLGWNVKDDGDPRAVPRSGQAWILKIVGLLVTVVALSLGAPFWFDLLNKIINIRAGGKSPREV